MKDKTKLAENAATVAAFKTDAIKSFQEGGGLYDDIVQAMRPLNEGLSDTKPYGYSWGRIEYAFDNLVHDPSPVAVADLQYEVTTLIRTLLRFTLPITSLSLRSSLATRPSP